MNSAMKQLILIFFLCHFGGALPAQPGNRPQSTDRKELRQERFAKIKAARQAYITEELELTEKEGKAFFPVFWSYEEKLKQRGAGGKEKEFKNTDLTEGEALEILHSHRARRQASLNMNMEAEEAYLKVLPARKVILLPEVERKFRKLLWERTREIRKGRRN
jgi:hypothetical protein